MVNMTATLSYYEQFQSYRCDICSQNMKCSLSEKVLITIFNNNSVYFPKILDRLFLKFLFIYFILDTEMILFVDMNSTIENCITYCIMWEICKQHRNGGETLLNYLKLLYQIDHHHYYCLTWMMAIKKYVAVWAGMNLY